MITTILWDVDGTLLDFPYSERYAITKAFEMAGLQITEEMIARYAGINDDYWKKLELGQVTKKELLTGRFRTLFEEFGITGVDVEVFRECFQEELGNVYRYLDDSFEVCKSLKGRAAQYVITNGLASTQRKKLSLSHLDELMDGLFISDELGAPKPEPAFFEACLKQIPEKDKSKILVVGDSISSDIKGGIQAGLRTCWYRTEEGASFGDWKPDYIISHLSQVEQLIMCKK